MEAAFEKREDSDREEKREDAEKARKSKRIKPFESDMQMKGECSRWRRRRRLQVASRVG